MSNHNFTLLLYFRELRPGTKPSATSAGQKARKGENRMADQRFHAASIGTHSRGVKSILAASRDPDVRLRRRKARPVRGAGEGRLETRPAIL
jgi:hypothetical protein